jgi:pyrroline-5-carboxylate reductase
MNVGFIGSGNMAAAMARGWSRTEGPEPSSMLFTDSGSGRATALAAEVGGTAVRDNSELVERSDFVVLAMKPNQLDLVSETLPTPKVVLSLLGATRLETLDRHFAESAVLRLMPNLAVEVCQGVICVARDEDLDSGTVESAHRLLTSLGTVVELADEHMDAATAMMGCTPAYFAAAAAAVSGVGVSEGLHADVSSAIVAEAMAGTASLLAHRTPFEIQVAVASPGGSTEAGLEALEEKGGAEAFREAAEASLRRMRGEQ